MQGVLNEYVTTVASFCSFPLGPPRYAMEYNSEWTHACGMDASIRKWETVVKDGTQSNSDPWSLRQVSPPYLTLLRLIDFAHKPPLWVLP